MASYSWDGGTGSTPARRLPETRLDGLGGGRGAPRRGLAAVVEELTPAQRAAGAITSGLLLFAVAAFGGLAIGPHLFGYRTLTMLTGSMAPQIEPGDVAVTVPVDAAKVHVGDVITFHIPIDDRRVETHRVVQVVHSGGATYVRTKGDANEAADPWLAKIDDDTVYRTAFVVPLAGDAIRFLRQDVLGWVLRWLVPAVVVGIVLRSIWRTEPPAGRRR